MARESSATIAAMRRLLAAYREAYSGPAARGLGAGGGLLRQPLRHDGAAVPDALPDQPRGFTAARGRARAVAVRRRLGRGRLLRRRAHRSLRAPSGCRWRRWRSPAAASCCSGSCAAPLGASHAAAFALAAVNEAFRPANSAAFAAAAPRERLTQAFTLRRLALNLGMTCGPALGGVLARARLLAALRRRRRHLPARRRAARRCSTARRRPRAALRAAAAGALAVARRRLPRPARRSATGHAAVLYQFFSTYPLALRELHGMSEPQIGSIYAINTVLIVVVRDGAGAAALAARRRCASPPGAACSSAAASRCCRSAAAMRSSPRRWWCGRSARCSPCRFSRRWPPRAAASAAAAATSAPTTSPTRSRSPARRRSAPGSISASARCRCSPAAASSASRCGWGCARSRRGSPVARRGARRSVRRRATAPLAPPAS